MDVFIDMIICCSAQHLTRMNAETSVRPYISGTLDEPPSFWSERFASVQSCNLCPPPIAWDKMLTDSGTTSINRVSQHFDGGCEIAHVHAQSIAKTCHDQNPGRLLVLRLFYRLMRCCFCIIPLVESVHLSDQAVGSYIASHHANTYVKSNRSIVFARSSAFSS